MDPLTLAFQGLMSMAELTLWDLLAIGLCHLNCLPTAHYPLVLVKPQLGRTATYVKHAVSVFLLAEKTSRSREQ